MLEVVKTLVWSGFMLAGFIWFVMWLLLGSLNFWLDKLLAKSKELKELEQDKEESL